MPYVDGFVVPVPKKNVEDYRRMSKAAGKVWREHGALEYREAVGEDLGQSQGTKSFPKGIRLKPGETVFFSWITYRSRAHRDRVNAKVMKDPRLARMMEGKRMPMDARRMLYGGFKIVVDV